MGKHFQKQDEPLRDDLAEDRAVACIFIVGMFFLLLESAVLLLGAI